MNSFLVLIGVSILFVVSVQSASSSPNVLDLHEKIELADWLKHMMQDDSLSPDDKEQKVVKQIAEVVVNHLQKQKNPQIASMAAPQLAAAKFVPLRIPKKAKNTFPVATSSHQTTPESAQTEHLTEQQQEQPIETIQEELKHEIDEPISEQLSQSFDFLDVLLEDPEIKKFVVEFNALFSQFVKLEIVEQVATQKFKLIGKFVETTFVPLGQKIHFEIKKVQYEIKTRINRNFGQNVLHNVAETFKSFNRFFSRH
jgi:hypothetical protein